MKSGAKITIGIILIALLIYSVTYFISPCFNIASGKEVSNIDLINNEYISNNGDHKITFENNYLLHLQTTTDVNVSDEIFSYSYNEGIVKVKDSLILQVLGNESLFNVSEHYFLYLVK